MQEYYDLLGLEINSSKEEAKAAFLAKKKTLQSKILSKDTEERAEAVKALGELTGAYKAILENISDKSMIDTASASKSQDDITLESDKKDSSKPIHKHKKSITNNIQNEQMKKNTNSNISNNNNNIMITIFGVLLGIFVLAVAVYFVFIKPNNNVPSGKPSISTINQDTDIISKTEMAKEKYNSDIANLANMINEALNKKGTLKNENKLHDDAIKIEEKILQSIVGLRNSNEKNSEKGKALLVLLEAERKRVRGLSDGLQAAINGFDYQPGFKAGSDAYYEYEKLNNQYINNKTSGFREQMGYVNGDNVFLRENPSTASKILETLKRNIGVDVIGIEECNDSQAGIVNSDNVVVTYNGQNIKLKKGQPLIITGENHISYQCRLDLENSSGTIYLNKNDVKKLYGEVWYKIKTLSGQTGWVYKDLIILKKDL